MNGLLMMLGAIMPEDVIINKLQEAITEHKIAPTEESRKTISMLCALFSSKEVIESNGLEKTMKEMDNISRVIERMQSAEEHS